MDFNNFGNTGLSPNTPYTTIASNPMFMSYASTFDSASPTITNDHNQTFFDMNGLSTWSSPHNSQDGASLDDLLAGYMTRGNSDYSFMTPSSTSESPVTHHASVNHINTKSSRSPSSSSSPSSSVSDPLFDTPRDSPGSDSDIGQEHTEKTCPKTKGELAKRIESSGSSPFAPAHLRRSSDAVSGPMIMCEGASFPKTQKSDQNVEVLSAWRSITSNPRFKVCRYLVLPISRTLIQSTCTRMSISMISVQSSPTRPSVTAQKSS